MTHTRPQEVEVKSWDLNSYLPGFQKLLVFTVKLDFPV